MEKDTITIARREYEKLKESEQMDKELLKKLIKGLEDVKHGRIKEWK